MVIKKMSEIMDTNKNEDTRNNTERTESTDPISDQEKTVEVSICNSILRFQIL
jgi:hypothetical protein